MTFAARKLGLGTYTWSAAAARQWSCWGREKDYLFNSKFGFDLAPWKVFDNPILSYGFTDDIMASEAAVNGLLKEFKAAHELDLIDKRIINPKTIGLETIGHFGFFKAQSKQLWQDTTTWIQKQQQI